MKKIVTLILSLFLSTLVYSQSVPSYVPTNGLVGWWGFNGNAQDASGNGNHGTVNGATLTTDRFGNQDGAYSFNGQNNRINITSQIFNLGWQNYTISAWFLTSNLNNANNFNNSSIILNTVPHNGIAISYYGTNNPFSTSVSNKVSVLGGNGSGWNYFNYGTLVSNNNISAHTWNHILLTRNGSNFLLYLNGNLSDSLFLNTSQINQTCELVFGNIAGAFSSEGFLGRLDDFGLWNRTLTHQEISSLYQSGGVYESISIQGVQNWNWLADDGFNVPSGSLDLGGVPFFIGSGGTGWTADRHPGANPRTCNVPVNFNGCSEIFFLLNTFFGSFGTPLAEIKLFFSDGTQLSKSLQGNVDIRDYTEGFYTNTINNTTTVNIFPTLPVGPGGRRL
ncbi:LamG domain-containing protein, partial [bacterium]|nr:LamG domain-containing protein [Candidatus Elulimicrobium humile]